MKNRRSGVVFGILFLAGLSFLLYPLIANKWNTYRQSREISRYEKVIVESENDRMHRVAFEKAAAYNRELAGWGLDTVFDMAAKAETLQDNYFDCLNPGQDGIMGYVEVEKIGIKLPIYHTTNDDVLEKGAGHWMGSSLPVGGESTHTVLMAHRGLAQMALFVDLDQMEPGDIFRLHILDRVLTYQVDQILTVEPSDTEELLIREREDLATLVTCTPYGINSHRLLVRGSRVTDLQESTVENETTEAVDQTYEEYKWLALVVLFVMAVLLMSLVVIRTRWKRQKRGCGSLVRPEEEHERETD